MKKVIVLAAAFTLGGCFDDVTEVQKYMNQVKATAKTGIEGMPEVKEFTHLEYSASSLRSPFVAPKPEAIEDNVSQIQDCLAPDPRRRKQPLEKYALDNISMKGTLGSGRALWALIQASDGTLHRITQGDYIGLFHGKVSRVLDSKVELTELIPDGSGCWKERKTVVDMIEPTESSNE